MKPLAFPLLTDENIAAEVFEGLRKLGCNLRSTAEDGLTGSPDAEILERATNQGRVVVTHDLGFGRSAIAGGAPFVGIIYLPGHISSAYELSVIDALRESAVEVESPFIAVAERQASTVRVRTRTAPPW